MNFLLWTTLSLHIFSVVVWLGGLLYQAVVTFPVAKVEQKEFDPFVLHLVKRFQPFVWMCVWTILVTGVVLMLFSPRFVFFQYPDRWSVILGLKQLIFGLMVFFSFGYARMFRMIEKVTAGNQQPASPHPFYNQMIVFGKINVGLAIIALLLAAALNS